MTRIDDIGGDYLDRLAALDPLFANMVGRLDHETELTDFSAAACQERADLARSALAEAGSVPVESDRDRIALEAMRERLSVTIDEHEAGEWMRPIRVIFSPAGQTRMVFDGMPKNGVADWRVIGERLAKVPHAVATYEEALTTGMASGVVAARRQALACARQAEAWAGDKDEPGYFRNLVARYDGNDGSLAASLSSAAESADHSYGRLSEFLGGPYAAAASESDAAGAERYALASRYSNGMAVDPRSTYEWGYEELHRIESEMISTASEIRGGASVAEAMAILDADDAGAVFGEDALREWNQGLLDETIAALDGDHFDIPEPVKRLEAMIAPPGGAAAMYYTGPSKDFSRPGRTWYPTQGRTRFPLWVEYSIAYHEGTPGHHLQIATVTWLGDRLSPIQREMDNSGHIEGWALYAERLMGELGYLDDPGRRLGMLSGQAFRAARVIVDIGLHHEYRIPDGEPYHGGERWTPDLAIPFMAAWSGRTTEFAASEVDRYLGWPAQAISYKVGERVWLDTRDAARRRLGAAFDLKEFHRQGFELGFVGLDQLRRELGDGGVNR